MPLRTRGTWAVLIILAVVVIAGWSSTGPPPRVYRVGVDNAPPYYSHGPDGKLQGLAVDVLNEAARRRSIHLEWVPVKVSIDQALSAKLVDLWPVVGITPDRLHRFHLTIPWMDNDFVLLSKDQKPLRTVAETIGETVAHGRLTTATRLAQAIFPQAKRVIVPTREEAVQALCRGQAAGAFVEQRFAETVLLRRPEGCESTALALHHLSGGTIRYAIGSGPQASAAADSLRDEIGRLSADGTLGALIEKWAPLATEATRSVETLEQSRRETRELILVVIAFALLSAMLLWQAHQRGRAYRALNKAQQELSDSKRFIEKVAAAAPSLIYVYDRAGQKNVYVSQSPSRMIGNDPDQTEEITGLAQFLAHIHPEDRARMEDHLAQAAALSDGQVLDVEYRVRHAGGHWLWMSNRDTVFSRDTQGQATQLLGVATDITVRKQAELALRDAHQHLEQRVLARTAELAALASELQVSLGRFAALADAMPQMVWTASPSGKIDYQNQYCYRYTGLTPAQFQAEGWKALIHKDDWHSVRRQWREAMAAGTPFTCELRIRNAARQDRWHLSRAVAVCDEQGSVVQWIGALMDMEQQKQAEQGLRRDKRAIEQRFQTFMDHSPAAAYIKDAEGRMLYGNLRIEQLWNVDFASAWLGKTDAELWPEAVARRLREHDQAMLASGKATEVVEAVPMPDGQTGQFLSVRFSFPDEEGRPLVGGMSIDITERYRAEADLAASEQRYRSVVEHAGDLICQTDATGYLRFWNAKTERFLGYSSAELEGLCYLDLVWAGHRRKAQSFYRQQLRRLQAESYYEFPVRCRDGSKRWLGQHMKLLIEEGTVTGCQAIARDITERVQSDDERERLLGQRTALLESAGNAIFGIDAQGLCIFVNARASELLGYTSAECLGRSIHGLIQSVRADGSPYDEAESPITQTFQRGMEVRIDDEVFWRKDGTPISVGYHACPVILKGRITGTIVTFADISDRKEVEARLIAEATTDSLTGLPNRRQFERRLVQVLKDLPPDDHTISIAICDLDHFKQINDNHGHAIGDKVLTVMGRLLQEGIRVTDFAARIGGDEFAILLPGTSAEDSAVCLERIRERLEAIRFGVPPSRPFGVTATFGVAEISADCRDELGLMIAADRALYAAKRSGRNQTRAVGVA